MATREYRKLKKVSDHIAALEKLWGTDKSVERKLIFFAVLFIVSGVFLAIQTLFESVAQRTDLTIAAALVSISSGVLAWRYSSMNVEDRRILTAIKLLEVLGADIPAQAPISLAVVFDHYRRGKKVGKSPVGERRYELKWLQVEGKIEGENWFRLSVTEKVGVESEWKGMNPTMGDAALGFERNRNHFYLQKKERRHEVVRLEVKPNLTRYPELDQFVMTPLKGWNLKSVEQTSDQVKIRAETNVSMRISGRVGMRRNAEEMGQEHRIQGDRLLGLVAKVFDGLNSCRVPAPS